MESNEKACTTMQRTIRHTTTRCNRTSRVNKAMIEDYVDRRGRAGQDGTNGTNGTNGRFSALMVYNGLDSSTAATVYHVVHKAKTE